MKLRICSICKQSKPATRDFFHVYKRARDGSLLRCECIECRTGNPKRVQEQDVHPDRSSRMRAYWNKRLSTLRGAIVYLWWNSISHRHHKMYGFKSDLTTDFLEELWNKQGGRCFWTGVPLKFGRELPDRHPQKMSLDRLDNSLGYVKSNVVWASKFANCGRGDLSVPAFQEFLKSLRMELGQDPPCSSLLPKMTVEQTI